MEGLHDKYSSNLWDRLTDGRTTHHIRKRSIGSAVYKIGLFLLTCVGWDGHGRGCNRAMEAKDTHVCSRKSN